MSDSSPRVAIVDFGMGNLYNVQRACSHVGLTSLITSRPQGVLEADAVVLPGVGAMPEAMRFLDATGLSGALREVAGRGTPVLGVCLGLQLLMDRGSEFTVHSGLGIIPGQVRRLESDSIVGVPLKVPHIGWAPVRLAGDFAAGWQDTLLARVRPGEFMYFVHSYHALPDDEAVVVATAEYGGNRFAAAVSMGNVFACQFHPERSGTAGLEVYAQFADRVLGRAAIPGDRKKTA